jgi:phenylalanine-4-hydroxylase
MNKDFLPRHLQKYVVEQNYAKYTPVDQAVWRYILRQLKDFLSIYAHECYVEGLEKTGISIEQIPRIEEISQELQKFGWRAIPVSGFIPPAVFMELQSLGVLPIASDMRTLEHLLYTPAPDIVHEAAGHAPILIHPEFSNYLHLYAEIAKKAIISKEDLEVYEAIRELSDIKENPTSKKDEILKAEQKLEAVTKSVTHISEAAELSRMNWWTAEYGLIGSLKSPKIFGAGLLSSLGESRWCLRRDVKKIPLSIECLKVSYDITEPQPQLFVASDFKHLVQVLHEMAQQMAFKVGGLAGINKAIKAQSINTVELNTGLQISGMVVEALTAPSGDISYIRLQGPSQLSYGDKLLHGHDKKYHAHGFGTPIGFLRQFPERCPSTLSAQQWSSLQIEEGKNVYLEYTSGVVITGKVDSLIMKDNKLLLISLSNAKASLGEKILFDPSWGVFDMAVGTKVSSVFGGPADREAFGEVTDFVAKRVPAAEFSADEKLKHLQYGLVRQIRESKTTGDELEQKLEKIFLVHIEKFADDWLLLLEILELMNTQAKECRLKTEVEKALMKLSSVNEKNKGLINDGIALAGVL